MRATFWVVVCLLVLTSSGENSFLKPCTEEDVCSAIVFNQLALYDIKQDVQEITQSLTSELQKNAVDTESLTQILASQFQEEFTDIKNLIMTLKASNSGDQMHGRELESCLAQNILLQSQITSLEKKNEKIKESIMSRDEGIDGDKILLRQENEELKKTKEVLVDTASRLEQLVTLQNEQIKHLTIFNYVPVDCADLMVLGKTQSGVYSIYPNRNGEESVKVLCDLETNGGGWTVFLNREPHNDPIDFNESWENFKKGFGNISSEFWLGNDLLHQLTSYGDSIFRVDAENFSGDKRWAQWDVFNVADENSKYQLTLEQYHENSTMGDSLSMASNSSFTTFDQDNDLYVGLNCAIGSRHYSNWGKGGWWYTECGSTRPTAPLRNTNYWDSACWKFWNPNAEEEIVSLKTLSMKFRRRNYEELADLRMPF